MRDGCHRLHFIPQVEEGHVMPPLAEVIMQLAYAELGLQVSTCAGVGTLACWAQSLRVSIV